MNTRIIIGVAIAGLLLGSGIGAGRQAQAESGGDEAALGVVRQLTKQYLDVAVAIDEGFVESPACVPAAGIHYVNADRGDERLELGRPEVLLYAPTLDGGRRLVGAEWMVNDDDQDLTTDHDRPRLFGHDFDGPMLGHGPGQPIHYDLHAWAWVNNPLGGFAQKNPRVLCVGVIE